MFSCFLFFGEGAGCLLKGTNTVKSTLYIENNDIQRCVYFSLIYKILVDNVLGLLWLQSYPV